VVELRPVGTSFVHELVGLWRTTFKDAYEDVHTPENLHAYCDANYNLAAAQEVLTDPESVCRVAFRDRQPVGFYVVKHHECPIPLRGGSSELKQFYVVAAEYGTGLGKLLFDDVLRCTEQAGNAWVWLCVSNLNDRAQTFYRKSSFEWLGTGPDIMVGLDRLTSTIMGRRM
jgi:GNAT superfamily N-acetyltransferase